MHSLKVGAGLDSEIIHQCLPCGMVCAKCINTPTGPLQGDHQEGPQSFAKGIFLDQRHQFLDRILGLAQFQFQTYHFFDQMEALRLQACRSRSHEPALHLGQHLSAPQPKGRPHELQPAQKVARTAELPGAIHERLESEQVNRVLRSDQLVARGHRLNEAANPDLTQGLS